MDMNVQVKSSSGIQLIPVETRLMAERKIFIEGEINPDAAAGFVKKVMYLNRESATLPIDVLINSPGGSINAGMLMYDVIQASRAPIRMYCIGMAYSMGAVLFACGRSGRYMLPHSELMLHEPLLGSEVTGNTTSIKAVSDTLLEKRRQMNEILVKHTGRSMEEMEKATAYDHFFTPEESVAFGLCDEIVGFDRML